MTLKKIIDWSLVQAEGEITGTIASEFYEYYDTSSQYTYACDVDIGEEEVLVNVPVAINNRDIIYAQEGMPVSLKKQGNNKYAITGLSKTCLKDTHIIYMNFSDAFGTIVSTEIRHNTYRPLTYGELGTLYGYGTLPYGVRGQFDYEGNLVKIIRSY